MKVRAIFFSVARVLLCTLALVCSFIIGGLLAAPVTDGTSGENGFGILLLVSLVDAGVCSYLLYRTNWRGTPLLAAFFTVYVLIHTILPQLETWFFSDAFRLGPAVARQTALMGLITTLLFSPLSLLIWGKFNRRRPAKRMANWEVGRFDSLWSGLLLIALLYVVIYFLFGYFLAWQSSEIRKFYSGSEALLPFFEHFRELLQHQAVIFPFQILRGLIWAGLVILLFQMIPGPNWERALLIGLLFALPAGMLLIPNPYMPPAVRVVHFWETLSSNLIFGILATLIWANRRKTRIVGADF